MVVKPATESRRRSSVIGAISPSNFIPLAGSRNGSSGLAVTLGRTMSHHCSKDTFTLSAFLHLSIVEREGEREVGVHGVGAWAVAPR